ncbi:glycosyltransferase family 1 protein [uncultured Duncaniella sp.]|uniref:glycosyltransferase family 4 protein n=1 Tax=uncultured Duncaniella sp. TaxID=2768039 RepID=UPI002676C6EB|nr:glycosyltransferase family 1 protein [uncultured Duncaniella sp.]
MLILDNIIFSLQKAGGISIVWENIIKGVLNNGIECRFIEHGETENIFRNELDIPPESVIMENLGFHKYRRYIDPGIKHILDPFIFHSSYYRTAKNRNAINITTVHDFTYDYFSSGLAKQVHCRQKYKAICNSDVIVCISENTKKDLLHFVPEVRKKDIRIIYNGVSDEYHPVMNGNKEFEDCILYVGARNGYKRFDYAVDAIKDTNYRLLICGNDLTENERRMLDAKLGRGKYILKIRPSNAELNVFYNSVFCLFYPSEYEGFGIPVLEAQKAGCPVIAFNSSSIPEVIGDTPLLLSSYSEREFLSKINILNDAGARQNVITSGIENSKRFSWEKMSREYISLYNELINKSH